MIHSNIHTYVGTYVRTIVCMYDTDKHIHTDKII